jgi:hypothetical protein
VKSIVGALAAASTEGSHAMRHILHEANLHAPCRGAEGSRIYLAAAQVRARRRAGAALCVELRGSRSSRATWASRGRWHPGLVIEGVRVMTSLTNATPCVGQMILICLFMFEIVKPPETLSAALCSALLRGRVLSPGVSRLLAFWPRRSALLLLVLVWPRAPRDAKSGERLACPKFAPPPRSDSRRIGKGNLVGATNAFCCHRRGCHE